MTLLPILLPQGSSLKVKVGDVVSKDQVIALINGSSSEQVISISKEFGIPENKITSYLKKNLGDAVKIGELVAIKKGKLGFGSKKIISKFSGTVIKIDEEKGNLHIKAQDGEKTEPVISPVDGSVDFCDNSKIVLKTDKYAYLAEDALGKEGKGEGVFLKDLDASKLTSSLAGKVIIVKLLDKVSFFKIIGLDASGIITQEIEEVDFIDLSEKKISIPVMNVTDEDFKKLIELSGKTFYLSGESKSIIVL